MTLLTHIAQVISALLALAILAGIGVLIWKRALLDVQSKAMEVQADALKAYETRISQLEDRVSQQDREIANLKGIIEGKDSALKAIIDAIADTDRCLAAHGCANRVIPTA